MLFFILFVLIKALLIMSQLWVFEDLPDLQYNLTDIYNNAEKYNYSILLETAVDYYDELKELRDAVNYKEDHEADLMLRKVFNDGGPLHVYNVPYEKFSKYYKWSEKEMLGYEDLMNKTCKLWNGLKLKVKSPEDLEPESSGNF